MYIEGFTDARSIASSVLSTLERYRIPASPNNYSLWYEYHAGNSPSLRRTMDIILANKGGFDENTLYDLYATFFSSEKEEQAVRETSLRVQETLRELIGIADRARTDARQFGNTLNDIASSDFGRSIENLNELIQHLLRETHRMAGRIQNAGARIREPLDKIETLERNLEGALREAMTDNLTGVANRKCFDAEIRRLAGEAMNSGEDLALLMIDIDRFKHVNDTWGHPVGDVVLRHVAATLQRCVRGQDHVSRYGGEEFAVILPATTVDRALTVADSIRHALARFPVQLDMTPPLSPVTVSIGISCYEPGDSLTEWVGRTDAALYCAKKEGRNRAQLAA